MADVAGAASGKAGHDPLNDSQGWPYEHGGRLAGRGACACTHVYGTGVAYGNWLEAPNLDGNRLVDLRLCHTCDS